MGHNNREAFERQGNNFQNGRLKSKANPENPPSELQANIY